MLLYINETIDWCDQLTLINQSIITTFHYSGFRVLSLRVLRTFLLLLVVNNNKYFCRMILTISYLESASPITSVEPLKPRFWDYSEICLLLNRKQQQIFIIQSTPLNWDTSSGTKSSPYKLILHISVNWDKFRLMGQNSLDLDEKSY